MPAPRKYPDELRERAQRLVREAQEEDPGLSLNAAVHRIGTRVGVVHHSDAGSQTRLNRSSQHRLVGETVGARRGLAEALAADPGWRTAYHDDVATVLRPALMVLRSLDPRP